MVAENGCRNRCRAHRSLAFDRRIPWRCRGLHRIGNAEPELDIWLKEQAQGIGYGREAVAAAIAWASRELAATSLDIRSRSRTDTAVASPRALRRPRGDAHAAEAERRRAR
jgi:hypothetical protein